MSKILIILTVISLLILNLIGMNSIAKAQVRSHYMDWGDEYMKEADTCKDVFTEYKIMKAALALASYIAAIAEK